MPRIHRRWTLLPPLLCAALSLQASADSPAASNAPEHLRGTIEVLDRDALVVATPAGAVRIRLAPSTPVATVVRSDRSRIRDGSFLGITSVTDPDGSQRAVEVHVFPQSMRGTGEGSRGWDWPGASRESTMTNGTAVSSKMTNGTVSAREGGSSLTLEYKEGTQKIVIPPDIPVVALEPGQRGDLRPGAHVFVIATRDPQGMLVGQRVLVGKNGIVPPM